MSIAIGLWSVQLTPGKEEVIVPQADLRITNVALSDELADSNGRTTVKFTYVTPMQMDSDDEEEDGDVEPPQTNTTVICSLTPGKIEQATADIILEQDEEYLFTVVGKNSVYLTGNYIDQTSADHPPFDDEDDSDMDSEDAYDLRDVSSDVEMHADDFDLESDASRFEEVHDEEPAKAQKRPRESDVVDADSSKPSKAEKKQNKKLKAESGKAVAAGAEKKDEEKKEEKKSEKKDEKKEAKKDKKDKKEGDAKEAKEQELAGGVKFKDAKVGSGPTAKKGNTVSMRYIGKLTNGKVFDSNTKGKPFTFQLGKGEVIKGWDVGIAGMQVGSERKLTIPPNMGYGKRGAGKDIPPNATLIFEVKLIEIK
ncbi:hypothetical protein BDQ17DRAFT_1419824 [Cyathus striatus]|nr:hypothetical protein BDQ17DRAFT_1419824 [Cyathus striatus]